MWAIAMTEPGTGSDLAGMTHDREASDGRHEYVLNGAKTFITGGVHADKRHRVRAYGAGVGDRPPVRDLTAGCGHQGARGIRWVASSTSWV
jgi:hypothetical protein